MKIPSVVGSGLILPIGGVPLGRVCACSLRSRLVQLYFPYPTNKTRLVVKTLGICFSKKSRIRETKHLSTDADSSTNAIGGWTKAKSAKKNFFLRSNFRPFRNKNVQMLDHFFPLLFPKVPNL